MPEREALRIFIALAPTMSIQAPGRRKSSHPRPAVVRTRAYNLRPRNSDDSVSMQATAATSWREQSSSRYVWLGGGEPGIVDMAIQCSLENVGCSQGEVWLSLPLRKGFAMLFQISRYSKGWELFRKDKVNAASLSIGEVLIMSSDVLAALEVIDQ